MELVGAADTGLTLGGFIALASLAIGALGLAFSTAGKNAELRERITRLETIVDDHVRNGGARHERKE